MSKMTEQKGRPNIIGYWMSEKKRQKLNWTEFGTTCKRHGFDLVKLDLTRSLEDQGPFCVILHKLTDIIVLAGQGDKKAEAMVQRVESYLDAHPEVAVIDPLDNVRKLLDRFHSYSISLRSGVDSLDAFTPNFVELLSEDVEDNLRRLKEAGVTFPFVCKPSVAHGSSRAHKMCLIFNERGVRDCQPPCVAQSFINHNAILYKIYVVGDRQHIVERPSLKNFYPCDRDTIFYDSHDVSKADSQSALSVLDPEDAATVPQPPPPDPERLRAVVDALRSKLGLALLGVDVVVENCSGRIAIIDINAYPGYDGFPNFFESLMTCILGAVESHRTDMPDAVLSNGSDSFSSGPGSSACSKTSSSTSSPGDQDDSGFDTGGDSSDEKKKKWGRRLRGSGGFAAVAGK
ncbi:inositol-tetrakisphosphate 1-kinase-like [Schistocerca cancellata]|uniref:inositol-tetrakisphosphate 1-kinase-like n=1 Tax=Schistocerca cancellata TaxID=274614 RepID=UPI002117396A|nr:inositol-tetrakisphosphate 1-kinase-like [Schistocerca cancellata]